MNTIILRELEKEEEAINMDPDNLEELQKRREYLMQWQENHSAAKDVAPIIKEQLDYANWAMDSLKEMPTMSGEKGQPDFVNRLEAENAYMRDAIPMIPQYNMVDAYGATAVNTSGYSGMYQYIAGAQDYGKVQVVDWSKTYTNRYREIQETHGKKDRVRSLITQLEDGQLNVRFDDAYKNFVLSQSDEKECIAAANSIRNLLYGIRGKLWERVPHQKNEKFKWEKMVTSLVDQGLLNLQQQQTLNDEQATYDYIISELSPMAKNHGSTTSSLLENVWTQLLDLIYVLLTLIILR